MPKVGRSGADPIVPAVTTDAAPFVVVITGYLLATDRS